MTDTITLKDGLFPRIATDLTAASCLASAAAEVLRGLDLSTPVEEQEQEQEEQRQSIVRLLALSLDQASRLSIEAFGTLYDNREDR